MPLHRPTTTWRDWYNPLKGLTVSRIVAMEDAADRGQHADVQWFWHHMERTDVTVQAAIARRPRSRAPNQPRFHLKRLFMHCLLRDIHSLTYLFHI